MFPEVKVADRVKRKPIWRLVDLEDEELGVVEKLGEMKLESSIEAGVEEAEVKDEETTLALLKKKAPPVPRTTKSKAVEKIDRTSAARNAVLLTPELLELIMGFLPLPELWRCRNVHPNWRALVMTSPTLLRALHMSTPTSPAAILDRDFTMRRNPRLEYPLNPVLTSLGLLRDSTKSLGLAEVTLPPRWRTVDADWRAIQITEPPIGRIFLRSSWLEKYIECKTGITAGMLADLLEFQTGGLYFFHC